MVLATILGGLLGFLGALILVVAYVGFFLCVFSLIWLAMGGCFSSLVEDYDGVTHKAHA